MSIKGTNGKEEDIKELPGTLHEEKGESVKLTEKLKSDPSLMKPFVDQVESIANEPYSSADVSMSKSSSAGTIAEPNKDLELKLMKHFMNSTSTISDKPYSMSQVSMSKISMSKSSSAGLGRLIAGLVVAGIIILAVVLLFVFLS